VGPEVAGRDDLFFVYLVNQEDGSLIGPIWMHHHKDGLVTPDIPLFKQFKESIEAATKMPTPKAYASIHSKEAYLDVPKSRFSSRCGSIPQIHKPRLNQPYHDSKDHCR
jgi:hypothetical protein